MSVRNKLENKRIRKAIRDQHKEKMLREGNFKQSMWLKMKNKYGNFIYKLMN